MESMESAVVSLLLLPPVEESAAAELDDGCIVFCFLREGAMDLRSGSGGANGAPPNILLDPEA